MSCDSPDFIRLPNEGPLFRRFADLGYGTIEPEGVVNALGARVVVANYGAIRKDFRGAFTQAFFDRYRDSCSDDCVRTGVPCCTLIDKWLLESSAYVADSHVKTSTLNSRIHHGKTQFIAYRPPRYGRALVIEVPDCGDSRAGLFDIKGAGVGPGIVPTPTSTSNGLEYLGAALADFFFAAVIDRVFARTVPGFRSLPTYAVLDLGFDLTEGWNGVQPAGLHVRRAHRRELDGNELPVSGSERERVIIQIELILRMFGLTTADESTSFYLRRSKDGRALTKSGIELVARTRQEQEKLDQLLKSRGRRLECANVQIAADLSWSPPSAQFIDFGTVHPRRRFVDPLFAPAKDAFFQLGRQILDRDGKAIQPLDKLALDPFQFSRTTVMAVGFLLASGFRQGRLSQNVIRKIMRQGLLQTGFWSVS